MTVARLCAWMSGAVISRKVGVRINIQYFMVLYLEFDTDFNTVT